MRMAEGKVAIELQPIGREGYASDGSPALAAAS
jgi:hypothetical protein